MKITKLTTVVLCILTLAACDRRPFESADSYNNSNINTGGNTGVGTGASDPSSVAYFNSTIGDRVLFLVDQSTLSPQAIATLDAQAGWLHSNSGYLARIEGHADEQGTREYNLALGARRASAVQNYLISKGISPNRLQILTYGKERPIEICSSEACWAQNRRAITVVTGAVGS